MSAMSTIATPASRSTVTSMPTAASGRAYGSHARPAVSFSARTDTSRSSESSSSTLLRCQNSRRNRQVQVSSSADDEDRQHDEPDEPRDVQAALVEAEAVDRLEGDLVDAVAAPDDGLAALPRLHDVGDALRGAAAAPAR